MPVDTTPIVLPIVVFYVAVFVWLVSSRIDGKKTSGRLRWQRIGWGFLTVSTVALAIGYFSTDVQRSIDEPMSYELTEFGEAGTTHFHRSLRFTNRDGDTFSWNESQSHFPRMKEGSAQFFDRIKQTRPERIQVSVTATYDFGKLRAYHINKIGAVER